METTTSFGYWIRRQRKALDLTQQTLADRVGCSLAAIKKIEADERKPSRQIAERMADVLGVPADQHEMFLEVARGLRSVDQLSLAREPTSPSHPSGTVTFLYTDIENSTKLAQEHPEEWEILRARHHAILREAIESNNGYVFQVVGDGFCAAFYTAEDALRAAVKSQTELHKENWGDQPIKVRIGIHTGKAEVQEDGLYHAYVTLSYVQRLMSAGHGGQVLISFATQQLIQGGLSGGFDLRDLGEHRLKDFDRAEHLFQIVAPGLPVDFPPLMALSTIKHNLPAQLTSFVGREREIAEVKKLLSNTRLLTLTGPGGTGKTRFAIQVANELLDQYPDGVWLVELAPVLDPLLVPRTTAITVGLRDEPHRPVMEMLGDYLRAKKMLLLLDNCEHLIEACAQMADTLLHACPQILILATSREAVGIAGETSYLVPSLTLPDIQNLPRVESLSQYEAIRLFIDRATSAFPTFTLTKENASSIAQICQRLDGIPLAIELAASKIRALGLEQINKRLDDRFRLLTGGSRSALPRHQTLQATLDWSYDLLSSAERILFQRLSVFVNGWTLEAAETVCSDANLKSTDVLDILVQLINKSLVHREEIISEPRYRMLETIREYALNKLSGAGEMRTFCFRHLTFFTRLVEEAERNFKGANQAIWYIRLDKELDNLRVAMSRFDGLENIEMRLRLTAGLWRYWKNRGYTSEGREHLQRVLEVLPFGPSRQTTIYARALTAVGSLAYYEGDLSYSDQTRTEALAIFQKLDDQVGIAACLNGLGNAAISRGDYEVARKFYEEGLMIRQSLGDQWGIARLLGNLGLLAYFQMDYAQARSLHSESLTLFRELRDDEGIGNELVNLGDVVRHQGELVTANSFYRESVMISVKLMDRWGLGYALMGMGNIALAQSDFAVAAFYYKDCLLIFQKGGDYAGLPFALEAVAELALLKNQPENAARIFGAAAILRKNTNSPLPLPDQSSYQKNLSLLQQQLNPAAFDLIWAAGQKISLNEVFDLALKTVEEM